MCHIVDTPSSVNHFSQAHPAENDNENSPDGSGVLPSKLVAASRHIGSVVSPSFRLEIMEDAFSLLFSRIEHLRDSVDSPDRQSCDSEPENVDKDVADQTHQKSVDAAGLSVCSENTTSVSDEIATANEMALAEIPHVEALIIESRCSPMYVSSSSVDGRSDELLGSQTVGNSSLQRGNESGFLARDHVVRDVLLLLSNCCESALKLVSVDNPSLPADELTDNLRLRTKALQEHVDSAQWRLQIVMPSSTVSSSPERCLLKQQQRQSRHRRDGVSRRVSDTSSMASDLKHTENTVTLDAFDMVEGSYLECFVGRSR